jgi:hypothetical protein
MSRTKVEGGMQLADYLIALEDCLWAAGDESLPASERVEYAEAALNALDRLEKLEAVQRLQDLLGGRGRREAKTRCRPGRLSKSASQNWRQREQFRRASRI